MTPEEWAGCADFEQMRRYLRGRSSDRKARLSAIAACRLVGRLLGVTHSEKTLQVAERFADGLATAADLAAASKAARHSLAPFSMPDRPPSDPAARMTFAIAFTAAPLHQLSWDALSLLTEIAPPAIAAGSITVPELVRDIFGNPFRPAPAPPDSVLSWNGGAVLRLAHTAYEQRRLPEGTLDPELLGVLCDALEDAGFEDSEALAHLRAEGPHYRGCHVLDALTGRS